MSSQEYRDDGWPLCPQCGDDELWSAAVPADPLGPLACYRCRWQGTVPAARWRMVRLSNHETHVYPLDDVKEHVLEGDTCWCMPAPSKTDLGNPMYGHNAADGREWLEPDHPKLN